MTLFLIFCAIGAAVCLILWALSPSKDNRSRLDQMRDAQSHFNPDLGLAGIKYRGKRADDLSEFAGKLAHEGGAIVGLMESEGQAEAVYQRIKHDLAHMTQRLDMAFQLEQEKFDHEVAKLKNELLVLAKASEQGLTPEGLEKLIIEERLLMLKILAEQRARENEVKLELDKAKGFKELDAWANEVEANLDKKMAELKEMWPQHELDVIHKKLSDAYKQRGAIKQLPSALVRDEELNRMNGYIESLEGELERRKKGLL
jgi:hypothetical protein